MSSLVLLSLFVCAAQDVSIASKPARRVRLHVESSEIATRVIDTRTQQAVCVGACDELLVADSETHYRVIQPGLDSPEFTLSEIEANGVFRERPRSWPLTNVGIAVTATGVVAAAAGVVLFFVGWIGAAATSHGLGPGAPWTNTMMRGAVASAAIGAPVALIGLPFLLRGLRRPLEVTEAE